MKFRSLIFSFIASAIAGNLAVATQASAVANMTSTYVTTSPAFRSATRYQAQALLGLLTSQGQAMLIHGFGSNDQANWRYFPSPKVSMFPEHTGISMGALDAKKQDAVMKLVETVLSSSGMEAVAAAREADSDPNVHREALHRALFKYGRENYFLSYFGQPGDSDWAMRFEGHHISINITMKDDQIVSASPLFIGAHPANYSVDGKPVSIHGPMLATLKDFLGKLTEDQLRRASTPVSAIPKDLLYSTDVYGNDRSNDDIRSEIAKTPGLSVTELSPQMQGMLVKVAMLYWSHLVTEAHQPSMAKIRAQGLEKIEFVFSGDTTLQKAYYWRIQGPSFVLEFGIGDENPEHFHVMWRDLM